MSVNTDTCFRPFGFRQSFKVTPPNITGAIFRIHHTIIMGYGTANQRIRFLHASFNATGEILAVSNHVGNVYIFDFVLNKYWSLVHLNCSIIKFSANLNHAAKQQLFIGATTGDICVYNYQLCNLIAKLQGHKSPVTDISFSDGVECVTLGNNEAILWNLQEYTKLQVLHLEEGAVLKFIMFVPVSNDLIACFKDESVQIWKAGTYQPSKQIESVSGSFNNLSIRSIAFTSNGKLMAVVGHSSKIYIFEVETLQLRKESTFTDMQVTVKKAQFLPNLFDDGNNKILSFLTTSGTLFFYNMQSEAFISKISVDDEVWKYAVDPAANRIATIMKSGDVFVHSLGFVLTKLNRGQTVRSVSSKKRKPKKKIATCTKKESADIVKHEPEKIFEIGKLKSILKEFGEYPELYRKIIWKHLLQLPNDETQYSAISNSNTKQTDLAFEKQYPLDIKQDMKSLRLHWGNLVTWCPFLSTVSYLPVLIFPFVKFLQNEPVLCFETLITLITNYCQYWFEYHPVPPLNILGLVEALLIQEDIDLARYLNSKGVTSKTFAWFLLQSMFSEVLNSTNWLIFCDHLITHDAVFLVVAVVAFSLVNKAALMTLKNFDDFEYFYRSNSTIDFKRFIARCYKLLNDKTAENHPRLYLKPREPFVHNEYPVFSQYPKSCLEVCKSINNIRSEVNSLKKEEQVIDTRIHELKKLKDLEKVNEEFLRHAQLNKLYCDTLQEEKRNVCMERMRLEGLRSKVEQKENELNLSSQQIFQAYGLPSIGSYPSCAGRKSDDSKSTPVEEHLLKQYTNLLKHKIQIEGLIDDDVTLDYVRLKKSYKEIADEINKTHSKVPNTEYLKQLNIVTGLAAVNSLIEKVESKILSKRTTLDKINTKYVVSKLASESEELSHEIHKLMNLIAETK